MYVNMFVGSILVAECLPLSPLYKIIFLRRKGCDEYESKQEICTSNI